MYNKNIFIFLLFVSYLVIIGADRTDLTRETGAHGIDVVEAVITLIDNSGIFEPDFGLMKRIAYVESKFGDDPDTFSQKDGHDYYGGIWQIDGGNSGGFAHIQDIYTYPELIEFYRKIEVSFGIKWETVAWYDLTKPLYSALAARLFLAIKPETIPTSLEAQANYWYRHYNSIETTETVETFIEAVRDMEAQSECSGRMDLIIVLDESPSISTAHFELAKKFVVNLLETFSLENVNLGLLVFSSSVRVIFELDNGLSKEQMAEEVMKISQQGFGTATGDGIIMAIELLAKNQDDDGRPRIITVFTDGGSNRGTPVAEAMSLVMYNNITSFAIGVGDDAVQPELLLIAQNDTSKVLTMSSYQSLSESFSLINSKTCNVAQNPSIGSTVLDSLDQYERRFYCYDVPLEGMTLNISQNVGSVDTFYSSSMERPSSAFNDGQVDDRLCITEPESNRLCVTIVGVDISNNYTIATDQDIASCYDDADSNELNYDNDKVVEEVSNKISINNILKGHRVYSMICVNCTINSAGSMISVVN